MDETMITVKCIKCGCDIHIPEGEAPRSRYIMFECAKCAQVWIEWQYRIEGHDAPYIVRFPVPQTVAGVEAVADAMAGSFVARTFPETTFLLIDRRELTAEEAMV